MAHIWIQKASDGGRCWAALPLTGSAYQFTGAEPYVRRAEGASAAAGGELLVRNDQEVAGQWLLFAPPESRLRVNGHKPVLGVLALRDRDELRLGTGQRLYLATERLPQIVAFPGTAQETICPRCWKRIEQGMPAVHCPNCGIWCHQLKDRPCWHYEGATTCPRCSQSNAADAGYRWWPEGL